MKRATEEQEISSSEEKRQKIDLEEFVAEAASEVTEEDTDQSEIEWLIDASLSDDPFKNHLAKKILGQNSLETEVPKNEEIPKPNFEEKLENQTKSEGDMHETILEKVKEKVRENLEIMELKLIEFVKGKDKEISSLNFELESAQLEQKFAEEKVQKTLLTTGNMIESSRVEKEELELKVLESAKREDLFTKREENLEMAIKDKEKTLLELMEQMKALTKSSEQSKAESDTIIADKNIKEKQLLDENKDLISKMSLFKAELEKKDTALKVKLEELETKNNEAQETIKHNQVELQEREKELSEKVEVALEMMEDIKKKDLSIKSLEKENDNLKEHGWRMENMEESNLLFRKEHETFRAEMTRITQENDDSLKRKEDENAKLNKENEDLKTKNQSVMKNYELLEQEVQVLKESQPITQENDDKENENTKLNKENEDLKTKNQAAIKNYELLEQEVQILKDAIKASKKEEELQKEQINEKILESRLDEALENAGKCRRCKESHDVKKSERRRFEKELKSVTKTLQKEFQSAKDKYKDKIKSKEAKLKEREEEIRYLNEQLMQTNKMQKVDIVKQEKDQKEYCETDIVKVEKDQNEKKEVKTKDPRISKGKNQKQPPPPPPTSVSPPHQHQQHHRQYDPFSYNRQYYEYYNTPTQQNRQYNSYRQHQHNSYGFNNYHAANNYYSKGFQY